MTDHSAQIATLKRVGRVLVSPGVMVELGRDGQHIALAYGGQRSRVDQLAVLTAARAALADWPVVIHALRIVVSPDPDVEQIAAATARRARRARRPQGRS